MSECAFETIDSEQTRAQATKLKLEQLTSDLNHATQILDHLRIGSDEEVAHIVARLRASETPASIAASLDPGPQAYISADNAHTGADSLARVPGGSNSYLAMQDYGTGVS